MEEAVGSLEDSVKRTDERLDMMAYKIEDVERLILEPDLNPEESVVKLIQSVNEVKNDYQSLRRELLEVQELQREVNYKLKQQIQQVYGKFTYLKERLAAIPNN